MPLHDKKKGKKGAWGINYHVFIHHDLFLSNPEIINKKTPTL